MNSTPSPENGEGKMLRSAVERILERPEDLIARVQAWRDGTPVGSGESEDALLARVAGRLVRAYSRRAAVAGGLTSLPANLPGLGTGAGLGAILADTTFLLKVEVEMAMSLTHLYGFDIRADRERQLAFLLASVGTYEAATRRTFLVELAAAEGTALWNYTPRRVSKAIVTVLAQLLLWRLSRSLVKLFPVVGVVVGASVNALLTSRVGNRCIAELSTRRRLERTRPGG